VSQQNGSRQATYNYTVVRQFAIMTVVWGVVGMLVGVWIAYAADEWLRGLLMWRRWVRLHWLPMARGSRRRLGR
jgi:cbb3-type cytochrome oxidase subunit 1